MEHQIQVQNYEQRMFSRFSEFIRNSVARTLETGEEIDSPADLTDDTPEFMSRIRIDEDLSNMVLPYDVELRFADRLVSYLADLKALSNNLEGSSYYVNLNEALRILRAIHIPSKEERQRLEEIHNLGWEYNRDIGSAAWTAYHLKSNDYRNNQSGLPAGVRVGNRDNAYLALNRISEIPVTSGNLNELAQQVASVQENFLFEAKRRTTSYKGPVDHCHGK